MKVSFLALFTLLAGSIAQPQQADPAASPAPASPQERWGIQIVALRLSAAGHTLDFRYKVLDAAKAEPLAGRQSKPYLEADGKRFPMFNAPRVGPLRSTYQPEPGKVYGIIFVNSFKALRAGDKVSIVIGDFRVDDVMVE